MDKQPLKGTPRRVRLPVLVIGTIAVAGVLIIALMLHQALSAKPTHPLPRMVQGGLRTDSAQWANIALGTYRSAQLAARNGQANRSR